MVLPHHAIELVSSGGDGRGRAALACGLGFSTGARTANGHRRARACAFGRRACRRGLVGF